MKYVDRTDSVPLKMFGYRAMPPSLVSTNFFDAQVLQEFKTATDTFVGNSNLEKGLQAMLNNTPSVTDRYLKRGCQAVLATALIAAFTASPSLAQPKHKYKPNTYSSKPKVVWAAPAKHRTVSRPVSIVINPAMAAPRRRTFNSRVIYRRFGPPIYGYGFYNTDLEAARWLAFTHITLSLIDRLEEQQVRYYEQAQIEATSAPIGEAIIWNDGGASGTTTAIREGADANGYPCREFRQTITIDGSFEEAHGTACLTADGTWQIVN